MTPDQFTAALDALGWKQTDFCRRAGLTKQTPSRWVHGLSPIPPWVDAYLGAMLDLNALYRKYLAPLPASRNTEAPAASSDTPEGPADAPARLAHLLPDATPPAG